MIYIYIIHIYILYIYMYIYIHIYILYYDIYIYYFHIFPVHFPAIFDGPDGSPLPSLRSVERGNDTGPKEHVETSVAAVAEMLASAKDGDLSGEFRR